MNLHLTSTKKIRQQGIHYYFKKIIIWRIHLLKVVENKINIDAHTK
jgi:hypothetical protein